MPLTILDRGPLSDGALPVGDLAAAMRLPPGWDGEGARPDRLRHLLQAAIADVEARTGRATSRRTVKVGGTAPGGHAVRLPVMPVAAVVETMLCGRPFAAEKVRVASDDAGASLVFDRALVAGTPVEAVLTVGHDEWGEVPASLREAVLMLAETLDVGDRDRTTETGLIRALTAPFRRRRLRGVL